MNGNGPMDLVGLPHIVEGEIHLMHVFTVTIMEKGDMEMTPWVSSFSSREKAEAFVEKAKEKLRGLGIEDEVGVTIDSGELDDEQYLDWIDARWEPENEEE